MYLQTTSTTENTFFLSTHGIFNKITHTLETNLNNIKKIDIIQSMFTNHKAIKLIIEEKQQKMHTYLKIKQYFDTST